MSARCSVGCGAVGRKHARALGTVRLMEKPAARTFEELDALAEAASRAHCLVRRRGDVPPLPKWRPLAANVNLLLLK